MEETPGRGNTPGEPQAEDEKASAVEGQMETKRNENDCVSTRQAARLCSSEALGSHFLPRSTGARCAAPVYHPSTALACFMCLLVQ